MRNVNANFIFQDFNYTSKIKSVKSKKLLRFAGRTVLETIMAAFDEFSSGYNIGNL